MVKQEADQPPTTSLCLTPPEQVSLPASPSSTSEQNPELRGELTSPKLFPADQGPKAQRGPLPGPSSQAEKQRVPHQVLQNHRAHSVHQSTCPWCPQRPYLEEEVMKLFSMQRTMKALWHPAAFCSSSRPASSEEAWPVAALLSVRHVSQ